MLSLVNYLAIIGHQLVYPTCSLLINALGFQLL